MVLQDTWLFGGTIRDNLRYGNPDATDEQISKPLGSPTSTGSCTRCPTATTR
jgi:ABC-type transport system involved in Fe-S cluster assembly fused permease/ATPase subunit